MADIEQRIVNTQLNAKIEIVDAKFNQFMDEMRSRDERRIADIEASRKRIEEVNEKIDSKFEKILSHIQGMAIATVVEVGAIVFGIMSFMKP